jgi:hypothetical protein
MCHRSKEVGIILGGLIIFVAGFIPSLLPIGIYWVSLVAGIPTAIIMFLKVVPTIEYCLGLLLGLIVFVLVSFSSWEAMGPMIAVFQIIPLFTTCVIAMVFSLLGTWWRKTHNKQRQQRPAGWTR